MNEMYNCPAPTAI